MLCIFRLDHSFVRQYAKKPVPWGWKSGPNSLGEIVCMRTYSRVRPETGKNESWHQICERVINGVFRMLERHVRTLRLEWDEGHAQRTAQEMYDRLFHMKFMPPGRGLWSMGTDITEKRDLYAALFNCFTGDTKFITKEFGPISFAEVVDQKVTVLTLYGWKSALVSRFGKQYINSITFAPAIPNTRAEGFRPARSNYRVHVKATANHRWILANGKETTNLHEGAFVKLNRGVANTDSLEYKEGFVHGLIFADGQMSYEASTHYSHVMRLCGKKNKYKTLFSNVTMPPSANGDCYVHVKSKTNYKELPANVNCDYESGFLSGLIAGDASQPKCETTKILSTQRADLVAWLKDHAAFAGYTITGINTDTHPTNFGERAAPLYKISLSTCKYSAWVVTRVEVTGAQEPVFCATVPETGSFTLASGVYTGNCAFTSTKDIITEKYRPFTFAMDALMLGIGVGFDVKGAGKINIKKRKGKTVTHVIPDSREGWVEALQMLLQSFFEGTNPIEFDTSKIRKAGLPIKGFGGKSSGPAPLIKLFEQIDEILSKQAGKPITERNIVDIFNMIGCCVVAGNIRRSAEIAIGPVDSEEFIDLKNYDKNPERAMYGWTSNNSVEALVGMDYKSLCERVIKNGEPGFLWLENARNYGRIVDGIDRRDIRIEGTNPCVSGDTRILTKDGYVKIKSVVGKEVEVWNGYMWSKVIPRITGTNQECVKVVLSDGAELTCTNYHTFKIKGKGDVQACNLLKGMKLQKYVMPLIEFADECMPYAYTNGFYCGDGFGDYIHLYGDKRKLVHDLVGEVISEHEDRTTVKICKNWLSTKFSVPMNCDLKSRLNWLAGLIDADGCMIKNPNTCGIQITSINLDFLRKVKLMLTTLGVNSKICLEKCEQKKLMPDGKGGVKEYLCKTCYRLLIAAEETQELLRLGLECKRVKLFEFGGKVVNKTRFVEVVSVEHVGSLDFVYCFNEPYNHTGTFEGIVTGQCGEIGLESYELCNLVELFPCNCESEDDFMRTIKFAYLYAKIITLSTTQWSDSNRVMLRNRRIGVGLSGIQQFIAKRGINTFRNWCLKGYKEIENWDQVYSEWLCIPRSIKKTTVKPSGTISLLAGATPGMHWSVFNYHIRRIRVAIGSELHKILAKAGYHIEDAVNEANTVVVEIPVEPMIEMRTEEQVSMWEQLEMTAFLQHYWADNQVSCTVKFDPEKEGPEMARALEYYQYHLKGISFLPKPKKNIKIYPQMPYEPITKEEYLEKTKNLRKVDFTVLTVKEGGSDKYCSNDTCTL